MTLIQDPEIKITIKRFGLFLGFSIISQAVAVYLPGYSFDALRLSSFVLACAVAAAFHAKEL